MSAPLICPDRYVLDFVQRKMPEIKKFREEIITRARLSKREYSSGLKVNEYRIKNMKTRWGTCNVIEKRIWINLQLAKKPIECLEYIIVHELVHLLEKGHNKRFYSLVEEFYPDWKEAKKNYWKLIKISEEFIDKLDANI